MNRFIRLLILALFLIVVSASALADGIMPLADPDVVSERFLQFGWICDF